MTRPLPGDPLAPLRAAFGEAAVSVYPGEDTIPRDTLLAGAQGADAVLALITERIDAAFFAAPGRNCGSWQMWPWAMTHRCARGNAPGALRSPILRAC
ncbi:MAG: hypothetical protein HC888_09170 [Candidatus Competibacteraceae bacterium]|nr:hypothetical protein [Candidatus Competibacteraceae bacterium]